MKTFRVALTVMVPISTVLEIKANNGTEAADIAVDMICEGGGHGIHDFDGNVQDVVTDDVEVDSVEEIGHESTGA